MLDAWPTPTDIRSKNDIIDINLDFLLRAKQGELEKAFEVLSNAGQKDAGGHRMRDEPWPGMLVLRKAAFGQKTETVSTCDVYYVGGCWKKFGGRSSQVLKSYSPACVAGGDAKNYRMFQHVLHLVTQKSFPHFYHFLTEFLSRVALLADFLKENPHVLGIPPSPYPPAPQPSHFPPLPFPLSPPPPPSRCPPLPCPLSPFPFPLSFPLSPPPFPLPPFPSPQFPPLKGFAVSPSAWLAWQ